MGGGNLAPTGWTTLVIGRVIGAKLFRLGDTRWMNGLLLLNNISANKKNRLHSGTRGLDSFLFHL